MEVRNNQVLLDGYVNVVSRDSRPLPSPRGKFIEQMMPGTFQRALDKAKNVDVLFNHNPKRKLGSLQDGNLELFEDQIGLRAKATISDPEVVAKAEAGELQGWSFGFRANEQRWQPGNPERRYVSNIDLMEVSILDCTPAYIATSIEARSEDFIEHRSANFEAEELRKISESSDNKNNERGYNMEKELFTVPNEAEMNGLKTEKRQRDEFAEMIRKGREYRAVNVTADGSAVIPENVANIIIQKMIEQSPVFDKARKIYPDAGSVKVVRENDNVVVGFVGEAENVLEQSMVFDFVKLQQRRIGAAVNISQQLLNDSGIDLAAYAEDLLSRRASKAVERSMLIGTGDANNEFAGIINDVDIKVINNDQAGAAVTMDNLNSMVTGVHPSFLPDAIFIMQRNFFNTVARMKDAMGHYYVQNGIINGKLTYTLFGVQIAITDVLPDNTPCVFGDVGQGVTVSVKKSLGIQEVIDSNTALQGTRMFVLDGYMDSAVCNPAALVKLVLL